MATIIIINVSAARTKAQDAKKKADLSTVDRSVRAYFALGGLISTLNSSRIVPVMDGSVIYAFGDNNISAFVDDSNQPLTSTAPKQPDGSFYYYQRVDNSPWPGICSLYIQSQNTYMRTSLYCAYGQSSGTINSQRCFF